MGLPKEKLSLNIEKLGSHNVSLRTQQDLLYYLLGFEMQPWRAR